MAIPQPSVLLASDWDYWGWPCGLRDHQPSRPQWETITAGLLRLLKHPASRTKYRVLCLRCDLSVVIILKLTCSILIYSPLDSVPLENMPKTSILLKSRMIIFDQWNETIYSSSEWLYFEFLCHGNQVSQCPSAAWVRNESVVFGPLELAGVSSPDGCILTILPSVTRVQNSRERLECTTLLHS